MGETIGVNNGNMRQHISLEQLNELSEKGKERLREWWKPEYGNLFIAPEYSKFRKTNKWSIMDMNETWAREWKKYKRKYEWCELSIPLLSIGQLLEYLGSVAVTTEYDGDTIDVEKMCDRLWEAVREILNRKQV